MQHPTVAFSVLSLLAALTTGCVYSGEQVAIESPGAMSSRSSVDGIAVGARAYVDPDEAEDVFGLPVVFESRTATTVRRGYLPVLVSFTNDSGDGLIVDKEHTRLISADGKRAKPRSWLRMHEAFAPSVAGAFVAFGVVGAAVQDDANESLAEDWRRKELPDQAFLYPNSEGTGGFLYFKDKGGLTPYTLRVAFRRASTGERLTIDVNIDPERS